MPRFVILEHDHPELHWDLMLDIGVVLRTWRLSRRPGEAKIIPALATFDHRRDYLDYEGPVGGNRGSVTRWDCGTFAWLIDGPGTLSVELQGERLQGTAQLIHESGQSWSWKFESKAALAQLRGAVEKKRW